MMVLCAISNPMVDLGSGLWSHFVCHAYRLGEPFRGALVLAWPMVGLAMATAGLVLFRRSKICAHLAHTRPRLFRLFHGPHLVPFGVLLGSVGLALIAPGYISGVEAYRSALWPPLGVIPAQTAYQALAWCLLVGVGAGVLMLYRAGREGKNHEKGSARWAKWKDVRIHPTWRWAIPIQVSYRGSMAAWGSEAGRTVLAPADEIATRHLLLVGQTGGGKGFTVFGPIIASSRVPVVYQDIKGQAPGKDAVKARFGKDPILWGCAAQDGWPSMGWNPVEECRQDSGPTDAFAALAAALIPCRDGGDDWVCDLARPILAHVLEHGGFGTLGEVQDSLMGQGLDQVLASARVPQGLLKALEGRNVREYLGTTFFSALAPFHSGWGREVTSRHDFNLADVCTTCTYVLSAEAEPTRRTPITVFWQMLFRRLLQSSRPVPLQLLFDEALAAGKIPSVRDALVTLRDRKVSIIFGTQHLSGLKDVYGPTEGESLIASFTGRIILLNGLDPRDREWLVKSMGQRTIRETRHKSITTTAIPLLTLDDLGRRASSEKVFWAVIDGPGMTRTGEPIIARMIGGPRDLIRRPSKEDLDDNGLKTPAPPEPILAPPPCLGIDLDEL